MNQDCVARCLTRMHSAENPQVLVCEETEQFNKQRYPSAHLDMQT